MGSWPGLRTARACGVALLALTALYLLFAILPFYANGIHLRTYAEILGSHVDVKGYAPFTWLGGPAQGAGMLAAALVPGASLVLTPLLAIALALNGRALGRAERALWIATVTASVAAIALTWSVVGVVRVWLAD